MNYMKEIACMLGVKFGEKFDIVDNYGNVVGVDYYFMYSGLENDTKQQSVLNYMVNSLLIGTHHVKKRQWIPKIGAICYYIDNNGEIRCTYWAGNTTDYALYKLGKVYRTREEAEAQNVKDAAFWQGIRRELKE